MSKPILLHFRDIHNSKRTILLECDTKTNLAEYLVDQSAIVQAIFDDTQIIAKLPILAEYV